jgi:hypothetical protein
MIGRSEHVTALILRNHSLTGCLQRGGHIPGQPSNPQRYADMWVYRGPKTKGSPIKVGKLLRKALQSYAGPDASLSSLLSGALADCDSLLLQYNELGEMRPLTATGSTRFSTDNIRGVLNDPDDAELLQIALTELSPDDWPAKSLLARACWPALSRAAIASQLRTFHHQAQHAH